MSHPSLCPKESSRRGTRIFTTALAWLAVAMAAGAQTSPTTSQTAGVVALPRFETDAVVPPWALDTRTTVTSFVQPEEAPTISMVGALRGYPGVQIDQPGGPGGRSSFYLRGGEANYTVVLLDGVPLNNGTDSRGGGFDFGTLDADEFAAAKIIRGPVSARFGPEALSGVVELTSDVLGPPDGSHAIFEAGPDGQGLAYVIGRARADNLQTAVSAHWSEDGSRPAGNFARHEGVAAGAIWRSARLEWRASLRFGQYEGASFPDDSGGLQYAVLRALEERSGKRVTAETELLSPAAGPGGVKWRVRAWGAWLRAHDDSPPVAPGIRDPAGLPASLEATDLRRAGFSAEAAFRAGKHGMLATGMDVEAERGTSDAVLVYGPYPIPASFAATRGRVGVFAEYTWRMDGWLLLPSVRVDRERDYGSRLTPRLGVKIPLGSATDLRINAGTGFKLPSFYAVSNPLVGNPALKPEKSRTVDAAVSRTMAGGRLVVEVGGFSSRYRDGVDFDPGPPPRLVNRSQIRSDGVEFSLRARPAASLNLMAAWTYENVRSEPGGGQLRGRPETMGSVRLEWTPRPRFRIGATLVAVGRLLDSSVPTGNVELPGWWRVDVAGRYRIAKDVTLMTAVDNLFDANYQEAVGVPSPGLRWRAGLVVEF